MFLKLIKAGLYLNFLTEYTHNNTGRIYYKFNLNIITKIKNKKLPGVLYTNNKGTLFSRSVNTFESSFTLTKIKND